MLKIAKQRKNGCTWKKSDRIMSTTAGSIVLRKLVNPILTKSFQYLEGSSQKFMERCLRLNRFELKAEDSPRLPDGFRFTHRMQYTSRNNVKRTLTDFNTPDPRTSGRKLILEGMNIPKGWRARDRYDETLAVALILPVHVKPSIKEGNWKGEQQISYTGGEGKLAKTSVRDR